MKELYVSLGKIIIFLLLYIYLGLIQALFLYAIIYYINIKFIEYFYKTELIKGEDFLFSIEYEKSPNIIIVSVVFERLSFEEFNIFFKQKILNKIKRLNQSMNFIFSDFYWKTHSTEESIKHLKPLKFDFDDISKEEKEMMVKKFIEKEFSKHMKFNKPLWKIYYAENYESEKSMFIMKFHHVLGDGGSLLSLLSSLSNESLQLKKFNNQNKNENFKKITFLYKFLLIILSPLAVILLFPKSAKNGILYPLCQNTKGKILGNNVIAKSNEFDINLLKDKLTFYKNKIHFTINDFLIYIINKSIKNYIQSNENELDSDNYSENFSDSIFTILGVSYRFELEEGKLENKSAGRIIEYDFNNYISQDDSDNNLKELEKINKINKNVRQKFYTASASIFGSFVCSYLMNTFSLKKFSDSILNNVTYIFSNIRGIENTTDINGKKILEINGYIPHACLPLSFLAVSYNNKLIITADTDKSYGININHLMDIINKNTSNFFKLD